MKKFLVILTKVLIWLGFFYNLGLISAITKSQDEDPTTFTLHGITVKRIEHSRMEEMQFSIRMNQMIETKAAQIQKRIENGQQYTFNEYFYDYRNLTDSLLSFGQEAIGANILELQRFLPRVYDTKEDIDATRAKYFPEQAAEEAASRAQTAKISLKKWFLDIYLKTLPLALLLFLVWFYEAGEYKTIRLRNPISFIISLFLYPLVIGYNMLRFWANTSRELGAEIEIRRGKSKVFSLLSDDELSLLKKFRTSNTTLKNFKEELKGMGHVRKHSFGIALIAFTVMVFAPLVTPANKRNLVPDEKVAIEKHCVHATDHSPSTIAQWECSPQPLLQWGSDRVIVIQHCLAHYWFRYFSLAVCRGHWRGVDHVPLVVESIFARILFSTPKKLKYEIYSMDCDIGYNHFTCPNYRYQN